MSHLRGPRNVFDEPAIFSIAVQGMLNQEWSERLGGMHITIIVPEGESAITTLIGELRDQAALSGVLDTLYELHLPVISVQRLSTG